MNPSPPDGENVPNDEKKPDRGFSGLRVVLFLFLMWLAVEMLSISMLGKNANATFSNIGPVTSK